MIEQTPTCASGRSASCSSKLSAETSTLIRQEMALARAELTEKGKEAGKGAGLSGAPAPSGSSAPAPSPPGSSCCSTSRSPRGWPHRGRPDLRRCRGVLGLKGRDRIRAATPPIPEQTVDTVKEDVEWAKTRAQSAQR